MNHKQTTIEEHQHLQDQMQKVSGRVTLNLSASGCLVIIAQIQLALRHPGNTGHSAQASREFVENLINQLPIDDLAKELLYRGFDPQFDEPMGQS